MTFCLFVWTIYVPPGHMTLKYTVIGSRAFAACACCKRISKLSKRNLILRNELKVNLCFHWPCTLSASAFVFQNNIQKKKFLKNCKRRFPHFFAFVHFQKKKFKKIKKTKRKKIASDIFSLCFNNTYDRYLFDIIWIKLKP